MLSPPRTLTHPMQRYTWACFRAFCSKSRPALRHADVLREIVEARDGSLEGWPCRIVVHMAQSAAARLASSRAPKPNLMQSSEATGDDVEAGLAEVQGLVRELPDRQRLEPTGEIMRITGVTDPGRRVGHDVEQRRRAQDRETR